MFTKVNFSKRVVLSLDYAKTKQIVNFLSAFEYARNSKPVTKPTKNSPDIKSMNNDKILIAK